MRKLTIVAHISLDGVIQHTPDENGFPYGDWTVHYRTPEGRDAVLAAHGDRFDCLLGRRTYDLWSTFWPTVPSNPMGDRINAATKYVVTHDPDTLEWGPVKALGPDLVKDVTRIKSSDGPDLVVSGSATLTSPLLENGLADQVLLITYPILLGTGKRLFAEGTPARSLTLTDSTSTPSGILINTYTYEGSLRTA